MSAATCTKCHKIQDTYPHTCKVEDLYGMGAGRKLLYCVEPKNDSIGKKDYNWKYKLNKSRKLGEYVVFPFVDSCLGIICYLPGDEVVFAHLNGYHKEKNGMDYAQVFSEFLLEQRLNDSAVLSAVLFGDIENWFYNKLNDTRASEPNWSNLTEVFVSVNSFDAIFDVDNGILSVLKYSISQNYILAPENILATIDLSKVKAKELIRF